jgi:hypothetical protein
MMRTLCNTFWAALFVVALGAPAARAQQQQTPDQQQQTPDQQQQTPDQQQQAPDQGAAPIPAYHSPFASADDNGDTDQQSTPDNRSLSGAQDLSPLLVSTRSYWQPEIDAYTSINSNPGLSAQTTDWTGGGSLSGHVDVHRISGNSALTVSYTAGGVFSGDGGEGDGVVQSLGFSDKFTFRRSTLSFFDQLSYLPGSAFGFGGLGGLGGTLPGTGSSGLGSVFGPGQTILTGEGQTLGNSFVTEFNASLTPRSSLTFVGGYYLLHNFSSGLLNSTNPNFRAGYNYQISRKNTIAVNYTFSAYRYSNSDQSFDTHTAQLSYGRVVTGKLAFQIAAGPQFIVSRFPISVTGSSGSPGGTGTVPLTTTTQLNWSVNSSLTWTAERNGFGLSYYRGANDGSGVLAGSIGDTVTASLSRAASRTFTSGISGGYSRNSGAAIITGTTLSQTYDYWFGGASLSHPVGRSLGLTLSYLVRYQQNPSSASPCVGSTCGTNTIINMISFGVGWHERPLLF